MSVPSVEYGCVIVLVPGHLGIFFFLCIEKTWSLWTEKDTVGNG